MIYGEEDILFSDFKGLWESTTPEKTPNGFCSEFINVVVNESGNIAPRGSFKNCIAAAGAGAGFNTGTISATAKPKLLTYPPGVQFLGAATVNRPIAAAGGYLWNYDAFGTLEKTQYTTVVNNPVFHNREWVMYRDNLYSCSSAASVYKISNWNFAVANSGALTETNVAGSPALTGLVFHKSRLFGWKNQRVYFTDAIAVGGYPETWNTAANFFDLPSTSTPLIHDMFVFNGTLYIFAEDGIYTVSVYGAPTNWVVKLVSSDIVINNKSCVCLAEDGFVYYTTQKNIFVYNGERSVDIGGPLQAIINKGGPIGVSVSVFPFEKGILANILQYSTDGTRRYVSNSRVFHFDGKYWSEFTFRNGTSQGVMIRNAYVQFPIFGMVPNTYSTKVSYLQLYYGDYSGTVTGNQEIVYYDPDDYAEDFTCSVKFPVTASFNMEKRFKYGYLDLYSRLTTLTKADISQGVPSTPDTLTMSPVTDDKNYLLRFKLPQIVRRLSVKLSMAILASSALRGEPPFEIKQMGLVVNTGRKEPDGVSG